MNRRSLWPALLLGLLLWSDATAAAVQKRLSGVVLSVLAARREAVVQQDASRGAPAVTYLFRLSPRTDPSALRAGDRIVASVEATAAGSQLDGVRVVRRVLAEPPPSAVREVPLLRVGDRIPPVRFVDQLGRPFDFDSFRGKSVVLAFIYTRCRDAKECPMISSNFHTLQRRPADGPDHLVEMTLDPGYDRPNVLRRYGALFDADPKRWTLGTGDPTHVLEFAARFGIDPFPDARGGFIHTERTAIIGADGKIVDFIDQAGWNADDISARLRAAESVPSNPIARLDFELSKTAVAICGNGVAGFSGLEDLAIVLGIVGATAWFLHRLARKIFAEQI